MLAAWEALVRSGALRPAFFPPPMSIAQTLLDLALSGELFKHAGTTLGRLLLSFVIALIPATALGLAMSEIAGLKTKLAEAETKIEDFNTKALTAEIDGLVQTGRILDAEKGTYLELARTSRPLFDKLVSAKAAAVPLKTVVAPKLTQSEGEVSEYRKALQKATGRRKK